MHRVALIAAFVAIFFIAEAASQGNWETYTYRVRILRRQCSTVRCKRCTRVLWGLWKRCRYYTVTRCNNVPVYVTRTGRRCKADWLPPTCTTAKCTKCQRGQVCTAPGRCECTRSTSGTVCSHVPCTLPNRDCYPGTCNSDRRTCSCPPGFSGSNCQTMNLKPSLSDCKARIYAGTRVVAQSDCALEVDDEPLAVWLSTATPTRIQVSYRADFTRAFETPQVTYISNSPVPIGITLATFSVSGAPTYSLPPTSRCLNNWLNPPTSKQCSMEVQWTEITASPLQHKNAFTVTAEARSGGRKVSNTYGQVELTGVITSRQMKFSVDLLPPTHCLLQSNGSTDDCRCFPIYLEDDVTTNPVIEPAMCDWSDDASDIDRYHVEVYFMNVGGTGELEETGQPLHTEDIRPPHNSFRYTCQTSGVYSIQLTVYDRAKNYARARQIFNYDGESKMTINDKPIYIEEADETTGRRWISRLPEPRDGANYSLTLVWRGRYESDTRYDGAWLKGAKQWSPGGVLCTRSNNCVDDTDDSFGFRTVNAIEEVTGILGYSVAFKVDHAGGIGLTSPGDYTTVRADQEQLVLSIPKAELRDGLSVVIWFNVSDVSGNKDEQRLVVGLDRSVPTVGEDDFQTQSVDEFTSSVHITAKDAQSGLKSITISIYDTTLRVVVWTETRPALTLQPLVNSTRKRAAERQCPTSGNPRHCYCISAEECFPTVQQVDIDNCHFDRYTEDPLELHYTVTNQAGLSTNGAIDLGILTDVHCRPVPGLHAGVIAAIVIVCLILLLLLILLVLMLWRWRRHKDPLPPRARQVFNRTFHRRHAENELYGVNDSKPAAAHGTKLNNLHNNKLKLNSVRAKNNYKLNDDDDDREDYYGVNPGGKQSISPNQIDVGKKLAEGSFAVVKRGSLTVGNESRPVALKMLKRGFGNDDRRLMTKKIDFLSSLGNHSNIVLFVGSYEDPELGPVMLLEVCEATLKDWLSENRTVTADMLEDILIFALDIARGVEFLHRQQIVHRRLGVRNVLLKQQRDGSFVAKLIGFGPAADSGHEESHPLRWMPPESHQSEPPIYNFKTDVWSYGITLWEMYSQGAKPYGNHRGGQVKGLLARGHRMDRPADCPVELFDSVVKPCWEEDPARRPEFGIICANIEQYRHEPIGTDYYAAGQEDIQNAYNEQEIYADAQ